MNPANEAIRADHVNAVVASVDQRVKNGGEAVVEELSFSFAASSFTGKAEEVG